jgi:hypothetical protein
LLDAGLSARFLPTSIPCFVFNETFEPTGGVMAIYVLCPDGGSPMNVLTDMGGFDLTFVASGWDGGA